MRNCCLPLFEPRLLWSILLSMFLQDVWHDVFILLLSLVWCRVFHFSFFCVSFHMTFSCSLSFLLQYSMPFTLFFFFLSDLLIFRFLGGAALSSPQEDFVLCPRSLFLVVGSFVSSFSSLTYCWLVFEDIFYRLQLDLVLSFESLAGSRVYFSWLSFVCRSAWRLPAFCISFALVWYFSSLFFRVGRLFICTRLLPPGGGFLCPRFSFVYMGFFFN